MRACVGVAICVAAVAVPAGVAQAAVVSVTLSGSNATLTLDGAEDVVTVDQAGGLLRHGQSGAGLNSVFDWSSASAGDQTLAAAAPTTVTVEGGAGDDRLTVSLTAIQLGVATINGGDGDDLLVGFLGRDLLSGGAGFDVMSGRAGDDAVSARDGAADIVSCGAGTDTLVADAAASDPALECEAEDRPAVPPPPAGPDTTATPVTISSGRLTGKRNATRLRIRCPAAELGGCAGTLTLRTKRALRVGAVRARLELGSARFKLSAGAQKVLKVALPKRLAELVGRRSLGVTAAVVSRDAAGNVAVASRSLVMALPRKR
jgi:hypothetical protein